jgi:transposase
MLAERLDYVLGVDTHQGSHALAVVDARVGLTVGQLRVAANRAGYRQLLRFARRQAPGRRAFALEGSGSYGAGLCRSLQAAGERVYEIERPARQGQRGRLKSDPLDAEQAARSLLSGVSGGDPRAGAEREALRALLVAREGAVMAATQATNELRALILTAPEQLRERLQGLPPAALIKGCRGLRPDRCSDPARQGISLALRSLAERLRALRAEARLLERELDTRIKRLAPQLLTQPGVGPISAAAILIAWSHPGRIRSEAAFARLAGAAPIPASSGKTIRHRLDRGGDRRLNRALHTIVLSRRRNDPHTRAYINRRTSNGKTTREAVRCLKRYLARSLYRLLERKPLTA